MLILLPPLEPALERARTFCGLFAKQQSFNTDIFIQIRPMDPVTGATNLEIGALGGCAIRQTRIPANRNRDSATVFELDLQCIVCNHHVEDSSQCECDHGRRHPTHFSRPPDSHA